MTGIRASFRLALGRFALKAELHCPAAGVTAIFGPSGSGKTTLLRCIAGLERRAEGRLEVDGVCWQDSVRRSFTSPHRRGIGYVAQDPALFVHLSVEANLRYGMRRRATAAGRSLPFGQVVERLGIAPILERRPDRLSGGERQRVALARALLAGPRLLLFDEPLSGLDEESRGEILRLLEQLLPELSVPLLYVSHSHAEVLRLADRVVLVDGGRVGDCGDVETLLTAEASTAFVPDAELGSIAHAVVGGRDEEFGLSHLDFSGGRLSIPGTALAVGSRCRVRFLARDVSLALHRPQATSILNVFPVRVLEIRHADRPLVLLTLDAAGTLLLSRITRKSLVQLGIRRGDSVYAQIKSVALVP